MARNNLFAHIVYLGIQSALQEMPTMLNTYIVHASVEEKNESRSHKSTQYEPGFLEYKGKSSQTRLSLPVPHSLSYKTSKLGKKCRLVKHVK